MFARRDVNELLRACCARNDGVARESRGEHSSPLQRHWKTGEERRTAMPRRKTARYVFNAILMLL